LLPRSQATTRDSHIVDGDRDVVHVLIDERVKGDDNVLQGDALEREAARETPLNPAEGLGFRPKNMTRVVDVKELHDDATKEGYNIYIRKRRPKQPGIAKRSITTTSHVVDQTDDPQTCGRVHLYRGNITIASSPH
jgi:hypothetical protein